jgi:hypothetical protein
LAGTGGSGATLTGTGGGDSPSAGTVGGDSTLAGTGGSGATAAGTGGGSTTTAGTGGVDATSTGIAGGNKTGAGVPGDGDGMMADFPRSIGDQRWWVWTWEDPSGTGKGLVARTLDVCLSRALSTGAAGALWCPVAVRTGADGTNTVAAGTGVEWTSTMVAWTSGGAKSSRESTSSTKAEVAAAMPCMKAVSSKEQAISRSKAALG